MNERIEDYALIGDCETAALVSRSGSIDWLCWPSFSSQACFAALLGSEANGYWSISPAGGNWETTRKYRDETLILETTFEQPDGTMRVLDFMPVGEKNSNVVRIVECLRGKISARMELALRFDYGLTVPWVTHTSDGVRAVAGPHLAVLAASVPVFGENLKTVAEFNLSKGKRATFCLVHGASHRPDPKAVDVDEALDATERFWKKWNARSNYKGRYRDAVQRSMMTLKALTYRPSGGIVAAVTTSLPERIGGERNWDYRFCWLRDTTFTLLALANGGYYEEAVAWQDWLLRALAGDPMQVQILYGLCGERLIPEWNLDWLPGYEKSKPVRIGNAASQQVQLDIYGEMLDSFFHSQHSMRRHSEDDFRVLVLLLEHLEKIWQDPDQGIWETRSGAQQFTYSKMMAWVAFDRAVLLAEQLEYKAPLDKWKQIRSAIHEQICAQGFSKAKNSFVQAYGSDELDASLLLMPLVGFLPANDPRVVGTVEAIERELMCDGLVMRYRTEKVNDGLPAGEGVFLACSFWMVSCLNVIGREEDARALFEKLLALRNDLGLLAEEYEPDSRRMVGNFPQAFSHIALVNAAFDFHGGDEVRSRCHRAAHHSASATR